ncbi:hypothetical protein [Leptospirillum ferriphilum]|uniref:Uncharacterized protein n=1 Tax=Leptospirillum ferriphilum (strain ML-04) TaxID=1048260 RepID=J9ZEB8_LEPFM|nr:hypothetical protein [Leptospirillum ferriphilum]AFS53992.1 hypothetical protein LFML04_1792 [Leptospirillum ferriphilum ML-04]
MISVLMGGRNDSHGYNMHKRVAISINTFASLFDEPDDEILFVDCNTRDGLPTLPEALMDTLTEKARKHLRVLRIRSSLYEKYKRGSVLPISESLVKNVAIRRSNPRNQWILSTTSDNVVIPRESQHSFSSLLHGIQDGLYELPRFSVPESLWGILNRNKPEEIQENFRKWGDKFGLHNSVLMDRPDIIYDNPGDFQLFPRAHAFRIKGFDEGMIRCWHHDSNLARRLYLLNGKSHSFLDKAFCYHCDHTWEVDYLHKRELTNSDINDPGQFIFNVTTPHWTDEDDWGIPLETLEEIKLDSSLGQSILSIFSLTKNDKRAFLQEEFQSTDSFNSVLIKNSLDFSPFFLNLIIHYSKIEMIYIGFKPNEFQDFFSNFNAIRKNIVRFEKRGFMSENLNLSLIELPQKKFESEPDLFQGTSMSNEDVHRVYLVDLTNQSLNHKMNYKCQVIPVDDDNFSQYKKWIQGNLSICLIEEEKRNRKGFSPSMFIFLGLMNSWAEDFIYPRFNLVHTTFGSHVMFGNARSPEELNQKNSTLKKLYLKIKTGIQTAPKGTFFHSIKIILKKLKSH